MPEQIMQKSGHFHGGRHVSLSIGPGPTYRVAFWTGHWRDLTTTEFQEFLADFAADDMAAVTQWLGYEPWAGPPPKPMPQRPAQPIALTLEDLGL